MADKKRDILEFVEQSNFEQFTPTRNSLSAIFKMNNKLKLTQHKSTLKDTGNGKCDQEPEKNRIRSKWNSNVFHLNSNL